MNDARHLVDDIRTVLRDGTRAPDAASNDQVIALVRLNALRPTPVAG